MPKALDAGPKIETSIEATEAYLKPIEAPSPRQLEGLHEGEPHLPCVAVEIESREGRSRAHGSAFGYRGGDELAEVLPARPQRLS